MTAAEGTDEASVAAPRPQRRRLAWWLGGSAAGLVLLAAVVVGVIAWSLRTPSGSGWLLPLVPQLKVTSPQGSLLGDFAAEQAEITLPGIGLLRLERPRWHALGASLGDHGRWLHLRIDTLHADRVTWLPDPAQPATTRAPAQPPRTLRLPLEIEIREATVDELRIGSANALPVRALRAGVHLGAEGGARHRLESAAARIEQGSATGTIAIAADPPFAVDAHVDAQSNATGAGTGIAFGATVLARGPLDALSVTAAARVPATATHGAQSLDARAVVKPFAAWPLGELQARADALDLSAFSTAAPATSLTGRAVATTSGSDVPASVTLDVKNARAGRWNEGLLPVLHARAELRARPDDPGTLDVQTLEATLGSSQLAGGKIAARGRWTPVAWNVDADLAKVRPDALDARAPATALDGTLALRGSGFGGAAASSAASAATSATTSAASSTATSTATSTASSGPADTRVVELVAALAGPLVDRRLPATAPRQAQLRLEARAAANEIEVKKAEARLGAASATLAGKLSRSDPATPWRARAQATLAGFDPAPWWPGAPGAFFARGKNRIDASGDVDLVWPSTMPSDSLYAMAAALRGKATLHVAPSTLAGVPVQGQASFVNDDGAPRPAVDGVAGGNRVQARGRIAVTGQERDAWQFTIDAPQLVTLAPWVPATAAAPSASGKRGASSAARIAGSLQAQGRLAGRWPDMTSEGDLRASALRFEALGVRQASGRWKLGSAATSPLDATLVLDGADIAGRAIEHAEAMLSGTARAHRAELRIASAALPPEWADALARQRGVVVNAAASTAASRSASASSASASASSTKPSTTAIPSARSLLTVIAEGGLVDTTNERATGWRGSVRELTARSVDAPVRTWLAARDLRGSVAWAGGLLRASLEPGSIEALGATLRWSRFAWLAGVGTAPAQLDAQATLDAFPVAPALRAWQPDFGWGGDLAVTARLDVRSAPTVKVDAVIERAAGDLTVTDELQTQRLGITDLRFSAAATNGTWNFTGAVAGASLGVVSGGATVRASPTAAWPDAQATLEGGLGARVDQLGIWGNWVPPGWRLAGELRASANLTGRFGAPQYTGRIDGTGLGVRNFVEGVSVTDGTVAIALQGTSAHIERFTAKGGNGTVRLEGDAAFEDAPIAKLRLVAEKFQMLGRVDRRIVTSGSAALQLDAKTIGLNGEFVIDEGLVDFTRADAPTLGSDVEVVRRPAVAPATLVNASRGTVTSVAPAASAAMPAAATAAAPAVPALAAKSSSRAVALDLRVGMGEQLRVRGRGLDAGLRGELRVTSPGGRLAVNGTLSTVDGTYQAYGQKLGIDRGVLTFTGLVENPRLDIEATRPNLDVRVGVTVTGSALAPRVRLFSDSDLSDLDKLSWLVLGHASETGGGADAALLQQAAVALLSGEGPGVTDRLIRSIGLDEVSVRQSQGAVKDTIVSLGKQISKRWYVGYERGLNTTTGTWQLIYRIAQRITVRAEAGGDNAVDVNWTLRWK